MIAKRLIFVYVHLKRRYPSFKFSNVFSNKLGPMNIEAAAGIPQYRLPFLQQLMKEVIKSSSRTFVVGPCPCRFGNCSTPLHDGRRCCRPWAELIVLSDCGVREELNAKIVKREIVKQKDEPILLWNHWCLVYLLWNAAQILWSPWCDGVRGGLVSLLGTSTSSLPF